LDEKTFDEQKSDIWVIILKYLLIVLNTYNYIIIIKNISLNHLL
jgi:hypothetical protein